jgi:hypothetical protein
MRPNFDQPFVYFIGVFATWVLVFFPFAIIATRIARADALNVVEAYFLGQTCGPVGLWLIKRANDRAAQRACQVALTLQAPAEPEIADVVDPRKRITEGIPAMEERPGARAFKPPPERKPRQTGPVKMDSWKPPVKP